MFFKKKCKHDPDMFISVEEGELTEPGGEPRKIKIRLLCVKCLKCDAILKIAPVGIAQDLVRGVHMPNTGKEIHANPSKEEKKQLLAEIQAS